MFTVYCLLGDSWEQTWWQSLSQLRGIGRAKERGEPGEVLGDCDEPFCD